MFSQCWFVSNQILGWSDRLPWSGSPSATNSRPFDFVRIKLMNCFWSVAILLVKIWALFKKNTDSREKIILKSRIQPGIRWLIYLPLRKCDSPIPPNYILNIYFQISHRLSEIKFEVQSLLVAILSELHQWNLKEIISELQLKVECNFVDVYESFGDIRWELLTTCVWDSEISHGHFYHIARCYFVKLQNEMIGRTVASDFGERLTCLEMTKCHFARILLHRKKWGERQ